MHSLKIRELKHVMTLEFSQSGGQTSQLLDLLSDYLEHSQGTLQAVTFHNSDGEDGEGYREWIVAYVECPYADTIDFGV